MMRATVGVMIVACVGCHAAVGAPAPQPAVARVSAPVIVSSGAPTSSASAVVSRDGRFFPPWTPEADHLDQIHVVEPPELARDGVVYSASRDGYTSPLGSFDGASAALVPRPGPLAISPYGNNDSRGTIGNANDARKKLDALLRHCLPKSQDLAPTLSGHVHMDIEVGANGEVAWVRLETTSDVPDSVGECMLDQAQRQRFVKPDPQPADIRVDIELAP